MNCRQHPGASLGETHAVIAEFESVAADTLALRNRLLRRRQCWLGQWAGQPLRVEWQRAEAPIADAVDVGLRIGAASGCLRLSRPLLLRLMEPLGLSGSFAALSGPAQSLLIEWALLEWVEPLERLLGETINVVDAVAQFSPLMIHLGVALSDQPAEPVQLELAPSLAERAAELLESHFTDDPRAMADLRLPLCVEGGWQWLTLTELRSLRPGDVLMLERPLAADLLLNLGGERQAGARREDGKAHLLEALQAFDPIKEKPMSRMIEEQDAPAGLDDLQIKVVCQLGTLELSLAQLQSLGEGSVLELPGREAEAVELTVNGRGIGRGELVRIGTGLGVRLTRFAES